MLGLLHQSLGDECSQTHSAAARQPGRKRLRPKAVLTLADSVPSRSWQLRKGTLQLAKNHVQEDALKLRSRLLRLGLRRICDGIRASHNR